MVSIYEIAKLSIVAVRLYFTHKRIEQQKGGNELQEKILENQNKLIDIEIRKYQNRYKLILEKGVQLLNDAKYAADDSLQKQYLLTALQLFTEIIGVNPSECVADTLIDNSELIARGFYGRFVSFGLLDDYKNSTRQVYECAYRFPSYAVNLFDKSFFPTVDVSSLKEICENIIRAKKSEELIGIYSQLPANMALPLLERQLDKYKKNFVEILNSI